MRTDSTITPDCPPTASCAPQQVTRLVFGELDLVLEVRSFQGDDEIDRIVDSVRSSDLAPDDGDSGPSSPATNQQAAIPDGWRELRQGDILLAVPGEFTVASVTGGRCFQRVADVQLDIDTPVRDECRGGFAIRDVMVDAGRTDAIARPAGSGFVDQEPETREIGGMSLLVSTTTLAPTCPAPPPGQEGCGLIDEWLITFPDDDLSIRIAARADTDLLRQIVDTIHRAG